MNLPRFLVLTAFGTALWSFVLSLGGRLLGSQWHLIVDFIDRYQKVVLILGILVVVGFLFYRLRDKFFIKTRA